MNEELEQIILVHITTSACWRLWMGLAMNSTTTPGDVASARQKWIEAERDLAELAARAAGE